MDIPDRLLAPHAVADILFLIEEGFLFASGAAWQFSDKVDILADVGRTQGQIVEWVSELTAQMGLAEAGVNAIPIRQAGKVFDTPEEDQTSASKTDLEA